MAHEKVFGFCENKCKVEVIPRDELPNILETIMPIGAVIPYAGSTAPENWKICNGESLSTTTYAALYAVIGTKYGSGSGTFKIPNLQGRVPIGVSSSHTLASTGGAETHTLTVDQIPSHYHAEKYGSYTGSGSTNGIYINTNHSQISVNDAGYNTGSVGGGQAHNNMQPYITLNYIIKVQ